MNLRRDVVIWVAKLRKEGVSEVGRIRYVFDLVQLIWNVDLGEVLQSRELDVLEALISSHSAQCFTISPHGAVWDTQEVYHHISCVLDRFSITQDVPL